MNIKGLNDKTSEHSFLRHEEVRIIFHDLPSCWDWKAKLTDNYQLSFLFIYLTFRMLPNPRKGSDVFWIVSCLKHFGLLQGSCHKKDLGKIQVILYLPFPIRVFVVSV